MIDSIVLFGFSDAYMPKRTATNRHTEKTHPHTHIHIKDTKTMRTERKRRIKTLIAIIMITHSRRTKTLCCKLLNTDSVKNLITNQF